MWFTNSLLIVFGFVEFVLRLVFILVCIISLVGFVFLLWAMDEDMKLTEVTLWSKIK